VLLRDAPPDVPGGESQAYGAGATKAAETGHRKSLALRAVALVVLVALVALVVVAMVVVVSLTLSLTLSMALTLTWMVLLSVVGAVARTGAVAVVVLVALARGALRRVAAVVIP
jgi:TRAP-type C4-dicarboxylate transport system permease small subunit